MSLTDPLTVTVSGTPISLPRLSAGDNKSEYGSADGLHQLNFSHQYNARRTRRMARFDTSKISADVYKPAENVKVGMAVYTVFDLPSQEQYTDAEALAAWVGFNTLLTASTNAVVSKLLGGES